MYLSIYTMSQNKGKKRQQALYGKHINDNVCDICVGISSKEFLGLEMGMLWAGLPFPYKRHLSLETNFHAQKVNYRHDDI